VQLVWGRAPQSSARVYAPEARSLIGGCRVGGARKAREPAGGGAPQEAVCVLREGEFSHSEKIQIL